MQPPSSGGRRVSAALFGSLALAAAPKCPFCLLALAGLGGSAAALAPAYAALLLPATAVLLAATVAVLALRPRAGWGPAALAAAAAIALLAAKFGGGPTAAVAVSAVLLAAATAWHLWPRPSAACPCSPPYPAEGPSPASRTGA